jgi:hypothetical protein
MNQVERVKYIIDRLDHYIESTNSKANLVLACNAVILGGVLTGFAFGNKVDLSCFQKVSLLITIISGLISCFYTILAILPYTKSKGTETNKSLFFFKDITSYKQQDYINLLNDQSEPAEFKDLAIQVYNISKGLNQKFDRMKIGVYFLLIEVLTVTLYIITIVLR